jgi:glutathione S-transferase
VAYSRARAAGLWQFIPGTGIRYGLKQNWYYDGRRDVIESTRAALDYLTFLANEFDGDWLLAIAAYNTGEANVARRIAENKRSGKPTDFFSLALPRETRAYVPKLLAMRRIVANPEAHNLQFAPIPDQPYFTIVQTGGQIQLDVARELAELTEEEFLALNPSGQVPLLLTPEGSALPESNAILNYLADGTPLLPSDRMARAQVLRWMFFEQYMHEPNVAVARFIVRYLGRPPEREETLQAKIKGGHKALGIMEERLASHEFFAAGRYTIADIALYAYTHVSHEGLIELDAYPAIQAWMARVRAEPGYVPMS